MDPSGWQNFQALQIIRFFDTVQQSRTCPVRFMAGARARRPCWKFRTPLPGRAARTTLGYGRARVELGSLRPKSKHFRRSGRHGGLRLVLRPPPVGRADGVRSRYAEPRAVALEHAVLLRRPERVGEGEVVARVARKGPRLDDRPGGRALPAFVVDRLDRRSDDGARVRDGDLLGPAAALLGRGTPRPGVRLHGGDGAQAAAPAGGRDRQPKELNSEKIVRAGATKVVEYSTNFDVF